MLRAGTQWLSVCRRSRLLSQRHDNNVSHRLGRAPHRRSAERQSWPLRLRAVPGALKTPHSARPPCGRVAWVEIVGSARLSALRCAQYDPTWSSRCSTRGAPSAGSLHRRSTPAPCAVHPRGKGPDLEEKYAYSASPFRLLGCSRLCRVSASPYMPLLTLLESLRGL